MTALRPLLDAAAADPESPAWDDLWRASCHQGTCDPDSAELLPWLARTCAAFPPGARRRALVFAGQVAVDARDEDRARHAAPIAALRSLTLDALTDATAPDDDFVYLLQAVLGLEGDGLWGKELDRLNVAEADATCPSCDEELLVDFADTEPGLPGEVAARLHATATASGRPEVAEAITRLFGRTTCPSCGTSFTLAAHVPGARPA